MYFTYNGYTSSVGEAAIQWDISRLPADDTGLVAKKVYTVTVNGTLVNFNGPNSIDTQVDTLEAAFLSNNFDFTYFTPTGTKVLFLDSSESIGRVKVTNINYPDGSAAEWSTKRSYVITLTAEFDDDNIADKDIVAYTESINIYGGGRRLVLQESITSKPVGYQTATDTIYYCNQTGTIVGFEDWPDIPAPIFPGNELAANPVITRKSPEYIDGDFRNYSLEYSYTFWSSEEFVDPEPTKWPE